jgi:hypothetical protein
MSNMGLKAPEFRTPPGRLLGAGSVGNAKKSFQEPRAKFFWTPLAAPAASLTLSRSVV